MLEPSRVGLTAQGSGKVMGSKALYFVATIEGESGKLCRVHNSFVAALSMHKLDDLALEPVNGIFFLLSSD